MTSSSTNPAENLGAACGALWRAIRTATPELPDAAVVIARNAPREGHYDAVSQLVTIPYAAVDAGAGVLLGMLLHQAAHALAHVRGIRDTSRDGRYHNGDFRDVAIEMGLDVGSKTSLGFATTTPTEATRKRYANATAGVRNAVEQHRDQLRDPSSDSTAGGKTRRSARRLTITCGCPTPRNATMYKSVFEAGSVLCGVCGQPFLPVED
jgi:hypothetical protein